ncbi:MAG: pyruvate kinase [Planctomycetia bacterium]|nr:pyruvate kinase [Planctomycetia bacterium]
METRPRSQQRARTKIIATVGPACQKPEQLAGLVHAGADLFRLNMAHGSLAEHAQTLWAIRQTSADLRQPIAVLVDLAGPKIRLGELPGGMIECVAGAEFRFVRGTEARQPDDLATTYEPLIDELKVGDTVMLADGTVSMVVLEKKKDYVRCRVVQPGLVRSRQGLNLPGVHLSAPAMDEIDRKNAIWAAENEIDFVGLSFVRAPRDVRELKNLLRDAGSSARVIAKIEKQEALDHLEGIISEADGIMVARGDLGVEINVAQMPVVQKRIVATCHEHQKPVIIATQMLDSMQHSRRPTRAEVTDVANAILDGGDACMLSGETAIGQFPREAVEMMNQVALAAEELFHDNVPQPPGNFRAEGLHPITSAVVYGAGHIAAEIDARLMVVASHSGATALALSKQRTYVQTVGISDSPQTLRQMCLYWGVIPLGDMPTLSSQQMLDAVTNWGLRDGSLESGDHVVLVAGIGLNGGSHNQVVVHRVP